MSPQARWEYMKTIHTRYAEAKGRREKGAILDEFCKTYDCHRKHALRVLNGHAPGPKRLACRPRRSTYSGMRLISLLEAMWKASGYPCGQRLHHRSGPPHPIDWPNVDRYQRIKAKETALLTW